MFMMEVKKKVDGLSFYKIKKHLKIILYKKNHFV